MRLGSLECKVPDYAEISNPLQLNMGRNSLQIFPLNVQKPLTGQAHQGAGLVHMTLLPPSHFDSECPKRAIMCAVHISYPPEIRLVKCILGNSL